MSSFHFLFFHFLIFFKLIFFLKKIKWEICFLAHLRHLFVNKKLHIVIFFIFEIPCDLCDLLLKLFFSFLCLSYFFTEEISFLGKFLFCYNKPRKGVMQESSDHWTYILDVIYEHSICQLFFVLTITTIIRQIVTFESLDPSLISIWRTNEFGDKNVIKLLQIIFYSFICVD